MRIPVTAAAVRVSTASPAAADGEESYRTRCALCHGADAAGSDRTYMVGGRQYVAIALRLGCWAFALPE